MQLKFTTFVFMHSKPSCVSVNYGNLGLLVAINIYHTPFV